MMRAIVTAAVLKDMALGAAAMLAVLAFGVAVGFIVGRFL